MNEVGVEPIGVAISTVGEGDKLMMEGGADVGKLQATMDNRMEAENIQ
jgi:hypothetical protein